MKRKPLFGKTLMVNFRDFDEYDGNIYFEEKDFNSKVWEIFKNNKESILFIENNRLFLNKTEINGYDILTSRGINNIISFADGDIYSGYKVHLNSVEVRNKDYNESLLNDEEESYLDEDCPKCGHLLVKESPSNSQKYANHTGFIKACSNGCGYTDRSKLKVKMWDQERILKEARRNKGYTILLPTQDNMKYIEKRGLDLNNNHDVKCECGRNSWELVYMLTKRDPKSDESPSSASYKCIDCGHAIFSMLGSKEMVELLSK